MRALTPSIVSGLDAGPFDPAVIGPKAANLAMLGTLGLRVPPWFAVAASAFHEALDRAGLFAEARALTESLEVKAPGAIREASRRLVERVLALPPDAALMGAVEEAYTRHFGPQAPVAVRSSALGEDSATHAFAGQLDSFLYVSGAEAVLAAISRCWASGFSERALAYRLQHGLPPWEVRVAVIIQAMAPGAVSGVLFTANPVSGRHGEALVSATYGLGEGLVSGALAADHWVVEKRSGALRPEIVTKRVRLVPGPGGGTVQEPVPEGLQAAPCLSDAQVREIVALGERIATHQGHPQDVEWTLDEAGVVVLQARPITTLGPAPQGHVRHWDNSNIAESYPGVTTPLTFSFVRSLYEVAYQVLLRSLGVSPRWLSENEPAFVNLLGFLNGRIYYNLTNYERIGKFFPARDALRDAFSTMIGTKERKSFAAESAGLFRFFFKDVPQTLVLVGHLLWRFLRWDAEVAHFKRYFAAVFGRFAAHDYDRLPPDQVLDQYRALVQELLWKWRAPMINDLYAMVFFGALKSLSTRYELDAEGSVVNDLLMGEGGLESTAPVEAVLDLAAMAREDEALLRLYRETPLASIPERLSTGDFPAFTAALARYMARYGYRCMGELKLELPTLRDDPAFVHQMIRQYLALPPRDRAARREHERGIRRAAEAQVAERLAGHPLRRALYGWVLGNARKGVRYREELRMARTNVFGLVRGMFLGLGRQLVAHEMLDAPEDVFYLDLHELFATLEGRATTANLRGLVALRRPEYAAYAEEPLSHTFETVGIPYVGSQFMPPASARTDEDGPVLKGTGCCPGRVANRARVVHSPEDDVQLNGEILVAEHTDPGWVLLFPLASGLAIEHGSLLSHAAVTARELGLPAVIGVSGLTRRVKDGQWLTLDGRAGTVTLGEPGEA